MICLVNVKPVRAARRDKTHRMFLYFSLSLLPTGSQYLSVSLNFMKSLNPATFLPLVQFPEAEVKRVCPFL